LSRLFLFAAALGLWLFAALPAGAGTVTRDLSFEADRLGRAVPYWVYRPDGVSPDRSLPTVYLLHGYNAGPGAWFHAAGLEETADRLIESGALPPVLLVLPALGNSWYVDSPAHGPVASVLVEDFVPFVEARHGGAKSRARRGVAGISMGGFGALRLAYHHPDAFAAAGALSPAVVDDVDRAHRLSETQLKLFGPVFGDPFDPLRFRTMNVFSPLDRLALHAAPPRTYITTGDDDYFELWRGASLLFLELRARGLPVEMRITDGGHVWPLWKQELPAVLRFLGAALTPTE